MNITAASPKDFCRWFYEVDSSHKIMCVLLLPRIEDRVLVEDICSGYVEADCALGGEVGLTLFYPGIMSAFKGSGDVPDIKLFLGEAVNLATGEVEKGVNLKDEVVVIPFRDAPLEVKIESWHRKGIAEASKNVAYDFVNMWRVEFSHLPALAIMVKDCRQVKICPLKKDMNVRDLLLELNRLATLVNECSPRKLSDDQLVNMRIKLESAEVLIVQCGDIMADVASRLERFCRRHKAGNEDRSRIVAYLLKSRYSDETLLSLVNTLSFRGQIQTNGLGQIRRGLKKLERIRGQIERLVSPSDPTGSIQDQLAEERERRMEVAKAVKSFKFGEAIQRISKTSDYLKPIYAKCSYIADVINRWGDLWQKAESIQRIIS